MMNVVSMRTSFWDCIGGGLISIRRVADNRPPPLTPLCGRFVDVLVLIMVF